MQRHTETKKSSDPHNNYDHHPVDVFVYHLKRIARQPEKSLQNLVYWFGADSSQKIPFEFVFNSGLIEIIADFFGKWGEIPDNIKLHILKLVVFLTCPSAKVHPVFENPAFIALLTNSVTNPQFSYDVILILSQMICRYDSLSAMLLENNVPQVILQFLTREFPLNSVSATFFILFFTQQNNFSDDIVNQILQVAENNANPKMVTSVIRAFNVAFENFPPLVEMMIKKAYPQCYLLNNIAKFGPSILPYVIDTYILLSKVIPTEAVVALITQFNIFNQPKMFDQSCRLFISLIAANNPSVEKLISNSEFFSFICSQILNGDNMHKSGATGIICALILKRSMPIINTIIESNVLQEIVEIVDSEIDEDIQTLILQSLLAFIETVPNGRNVLNDLDINEHLDNLSYDNELARVVMEALTK